MTSSPIDASRLLVVGILIVLFIIVIAAVSYIEKRHSHYEKYSVGFQIGPHYLGSSTWEGTPYALSDPVHGCPELGPGLQGPSAQPHIVRERFGNATDLIYKPASTRDLRGPHPNWWQPDGGTFGLPVAAARPDFWAGDATLHTYLADEPLAPRCGNNGNRRPSEAERVAEWRHYGGPRGWTFSPYNTV